MNTVAPIYSTSAKLTNRKSAGIALALTTAARDGGMREDTLKLLACLVHPRTSQKYDKDTLSKDWDNPRIKCLELEMTHHKSLKNATNLIHKLEQEEGATQEALDTAVANYQKLVSQSPPQLQLVWDNINLKTKQR